MDKNQLSIYDRKMPLKLSLTIGLVLILIMLIAFVFARLRDFGTGLHIHDIITVKLIAVFLINILLLYILFRFQFWVIKKQKRTEKRIWILIVGSIALVFVLSPIFSSIQWYLYTENVLSNIHLSVHFAKDLVLLFITFLFTTLISLGESTQKTLIENQRLSLENLQNRYDALKNQVDPHFLFNSLNTLNGLIGYDDEKAHEYVEQLSSVFRYTMQNRPVIQLADELNFVEAYIYLVKIRYNDSLRIDFRANENYFEYYALPFSVQSLVENAVKHNVISKKYPLSITIETTDKETIKVTNNIQLKPEGVSSGIGLANLNERYQLLFDKEIVISRDDSFFAVEIPLIKDIKKTKIDSPVDYESSYC
jgi:Putative regulator of cell autolysis